MKEIPVTDLQFNFYTKIDKERMLITAGGEGGYNTMTASWGHLGSLWHKPTSVCYIRPQRYTKEFMDREDVYTLSFFPEEYRNALSYLGTHSGRDGDKVAAAGLTPVHEDGYTYFAEANMVLVCRKLFRSTMQEENFLDKEVLEKNYPNRDLHDIYIGSIEKVLVKE